MNSYRWTDSKGRSIEIHTMSNKWLNNLKKYLKLNNPNNAALPFVINEIKRRNEK